MRAGIKTGTTENCRRVSHELVHRWPSIRRVYREDRAPTLFLGIITSLLIIVLSTIVLSGPSAMERYYVPVSIVWALNG